VARVLWLRSIPTSARYTPTAIVLDSTILSKAFHGELVPQDPSESADLDERANAPKTPGAPGRPRCTRAARK
jgi:hypothetical protein